MQVFSTVHVPIFHPFVVAKMGGTLDHIGQGRWGRNVVSGWSEREAGQMHVPEWAFISLPSIEAASDQTTDIRTRAAKHGRSIRCATYPFAVWRETEREAEQERRRLLNEMDPRVSASQTNDRLSALQGLACRRLGSPHVRRKYQKHERQRSLQLVATLADRLSRRCKCARGGRDDRGRDRRRHDP